MERAQPILKWAGGKRQLLPQLRPFYPDDFDAYWEPFVGSAAVFFDLHNHAHLEGRAVALLDTNADLIGCYRAIRDEVEAVIQVLESLAEGHRRFGTEHYYDVRDKCFNPLRAKLLGANTSCNEPQPYPPELAAMFIYLNRTSFNGLFRVNANGEFNVPAGRYLKPRIRNPEALRRAAAAFGRPGVRIERQSFEVLLDRVVCRDLVYLDPPYAPVSPTASFTSYTPERFSLDSQKRLRDVVVSLAKNGCRIILSNSRTDLVRDLYRGPEAAAAGLKIHTVHARRAINSKAAKRGPIEELVITNLPRQA